MADGGKKRVLWLHTQPEHYFGLLIDALNKTGDLEYVAGYGTRGPGWYKEGTARGGVLLRPRGKGDAAPRFFERYHVDWRADVGFDYAAVIVSGYASRTAREAAAEFHRRGVPVVMWSDSNLRGERGRGRLKRGVKRCFLRRMIGRSDLLLTANSRGVAYWRYYGAPAGKIVRCAYYGDYSRVEQGRKTLRDAVLGKYGLKATDRVIYTAARLAPEKGLDLAIRAFLAGGLGENCHYVIAGTGPLEGELKNLAGAAVGKTVHFAGFLQPEDNLALMAHADLFVLPSRYEPHGIVVAEAMAGGTPVLASDVCGAAVDLVRRQVSGEMFRSEDEGDLRAKLRGLLSEPEKLAAMRAGTRAVFEEWFARTNPVVVVDREMPRLIGKKPGARSQKPVGGDGR